MREQLSVSQGEALEKNQPCHKYLLFKLLGQWHFVMADLENEWKPQHSPWRRTAQLSCSWISDTWKVHEIINTCHFKPQNFGILCYVAIDN